jgi:hypothetical protein
MHFQLYPKSKLMYTLAMVSWCANFILTTSTRKSTWLPTSSNALLLVFLLKANCWSEGDWLLFRQWSGWWRGKLLEPGLSQQASMMLLLKQALIAEGPDLFHNSDFWRHRSTARNRTIHSPDGSQLPSMYSHEECISRSWELWGNRSNGVYLWQNSMLHWYRMLYQLSLQ